MKLEHIISIRPSKVDTWAEEDGSVRGVDQ